MSTDAVFKLPSPAAIAQSLAQDLPGFVTPEWVEQIDSTNTYLLKLARESGASLDWPRLCGAHHQTGGKGRLGRTWHDLPGQALMFSAGFAMPTALGHSALEGLGPAIGITSVFALRPLLKEPERLRVKWPNDLMLDRGKCAGILIELGRAANTNIFIVGIGLNLNGHDSLQTELGREIADIGPQLLPGVTAARLVAELASAWQQALKNMQQQGFAPYRKRYADADYLLQQEVNVMDQGHIIAWGTATGLAANGSLQVKTARGIESFNAGDVSVRLNTKAHQS